MRASNLGALCDIERERGGYLKYLGWPFYSRCAFSGLIVDYHIGILLCARNILVTYVILNGSEYLKNVQAR